MPTKHPLAAQVRTCPKCGSGWDSRYQHYHCGSWHNDYGGIMQTVDCMATEIASLTARLAEVETRVQVLTAERNMLAWLSADTPQFHSTFHLVEAKKVRDRVLEELKQ